jgi:hypothetical protein
MQSYAQLVGLFGRGISPSQGRCLRHGTTQAQKKCGDTSTPGVKFKPTILVFDRAKTFHALDSAAAVIGSQNYVIFLMFELIFDMLVPVKVR